ncbi:MAG: hypothetical protein Q8S13_03340 [Dehalococcoidia bacterium]|nr:hypothetical protein [Dehalococcoidia bacterium]
MIIRIKKPPPSATLEAWLKKALAQAALAAILEIRKRTAAGREIDGGAFAPYTPEYAKLKREAGRNTVVIQSQVLSVSGGGSFAVQEVGAGAPNLTLSGQMLRNLKVLRTGRRNAVIGFDGQHIGMRIGKLKRTKRGKISKGRKRNVVAETRALHSEGLSSMSVGTTAPMASIVTGVSTKRPFLGVRRADERARVTAAAQRVLDEQIVRFNSATKRST